MKPYQKRVVEEHKELARRAYAIGCFLGEFGHTIEPKEKELLEKQARVMTEYLGILNKRIELFKNDL